MKYSDDATGFVSIGDVIPDVLLDIRYYSSFNFIGERIDGYEEPVALLTQWTGENYFNETSMELQLLQ